MILGKYLKIQKPENWLFPGIRYGKGSPPFFSDYKPQFGQRSIQWTIGRAAQLAGITKRVNVHCLRHTFATHLLEDGINILTIKELMEHAHIRTTMIYLHVAQINNHQKCSSLDTLQGLNVIGAVQGSCFASKEKIERQNKKSLCRWTECADQENISSAFIFFIFIPSC